MDNSTKKIKLKISLAGIELEVLGYDEKESSVISVKILTIVIIVGICYYLLSKIT